VDVASQCVPVLYDLALVARALQYIIIRSG